MITLVVKANPIHAVTQCLAYGIKPFDIVTTKHGETVLSAETSDYYKAQEWFCKRDSNLLFFNLSDGE